MRVVLEGDFGQGRFNEVSTDGQVTGRWLSIDTGTALNFFERLSIVRPSLALNALGLYSKGSIGRNDEVKFASMSTPKWMLRARGNKGCIWDPTMNISIDVDNFKVYPVISQGEQCPDVYWGECLEFILGTGHGKKDLRSTAEATAMFAMMMSRIYVGLGNALYDLFWMGQHPAIQEAEDNDTKTLDDRDWENFRKNQEPFGGWLTIIDGFRNSEGGRFNVPIDRNHVGIDAYLGQLSGPGGQFDKVIKQQSDEALVSGRNNGSTKGLLLVDVSSFEKYEAELLADHGTIPDTFYYKLNGEFCAKEGCAAGSTMDGILKYKGHWVVRMDEWSIYDKILGIKTFRILLAMPGVLGYAYDVPALSQFNGMGLRMHQDMTPKGGGLVTMDVMFKAGAGLVDKRMIVNSSLSFVVPKTL